jgi:hypothetical protein
MLAAGLPPTTPRPALPQWRAAPYLKRQTSNAKPRSDDEHRIQGRLALPITRTTPLLAELILRSSSLQYRLVASILDNECVTANATNDDNNKPSPRPNTRLSLTVTLIDPWGRRVRQPGSPVPTVFADRGNERLAFEICPE